MPAWQRMKITARTYDRLVIGHSPWLLALMVNGMGLGAGWGAIFWDPADGTWERVLVAGLAVGALALAWWAFPFTRTVFDRASGLVVHEERRLTGTRVVANPLTALDRAQVRSQRDDSGGRGTRLVLVLDDGEFPLESGFGPADRRVFETAINDWLTMPPPAPVQA